VINSRGADVVFEDSRRFTFDQKTQRVVEVLGWVEIGEGLGRRKGGLNMQGLRENYTSREGLIRHTARVIYHELRHMEANLIATNTYTGAGAGSRASHPDDRPPSRSEWHVHQALDDYQIPSADPRQKEFEREIELWSLNEEGKEVLHIYADDIELSIGGK
jgi:hypothetical protein